MNDTFFGKLFETSDYPARWQCGNWSALVGWLHIVSDALIFCAYAAIPTALFLLLLRRRDVPFPLVGWLFVAFILFCGITHAVEASIFWWPAYRLSGLLKAMTAIVSLTTAVVLIRVLPAAVSLPSVAKANRDLQEALLREQGLGRELTRVHEALENRTSQLAVRERRMRDAVGAAKACALTWNIESGKVIWQLGIEPAMRSAGIDWRTDFETWDVLVGEDGARRLASIASRADPGDAIHHRFDLVGQEGVWDVRVTATIDARVKGQPATATGCLGLIPLQDVDDQA